MPDGKEISPYYVLEYPDWINVVALTEDFQVILTRLYRHGIGATVLELPSGRVDPGEQPQDTAKRELLEETGFVFDHFTRLSELSPNPSNHSNRVYSFLATGGQKVAEQQLDAAEQIEVVLLPLKTFKELVARNQLVQAMHVSAAYYAFMELDKRTGKL